MSITFFRTKMVQIGFFFAMGVLLLLVPLIADAEESSQWGDVEVVPAEAGTYYTIEEVYYENPYIVRGEDASIISKEFVAVKAVIYGKGFKQKATGPAFWLNGYFTMKAKVSLDGKFVEAYFSEPLNALEKVAEVKGGWELIYKSHDGVKTVQRLSPTGNPADVNQPPAIVRLSPEELTRVNELKQKFSIE